MLERWLTSRCWQDDVPRLRTARAAVAKFLEAQDGRPSGTEPFAAAARPDTFTYHFGKGRGVRWQDRPRGLLWLCAFDDAHDRGYDHAERLQQEGALYPDAERRIEPSAGPLQPWGRYVDEDTYEWAHSIYDALESWESHRAQLLAGETVAYRSALYVELSKDADDIWTMVIRRRLAYVDKRAESRERWLTNGELHALFRHLAGEPDEADYEFENPPHPKAFLFAQIHFLDGPITPVAWLDHICKSALDGSHALLVTGAR